MQDETITANQVPVPPMPATPMPPNPVTPIENKKKFPVVSAILGLVILILIAISGFLAYQNMKLQSQVSGMKIYATPMADATPMTETSATPSATVTPDASGNGSITGTICYPSSGIPAGKVNVKNTATDAVLSFENQANNSSFTVNVPVGSYKMQYLPNSGAVGYYTGCTGSEPSCQDNTTKRSSIAVNVTADQDSSGVKLCDYYYQAGMEPDF
ncbi:hypothetical protein BH10PAT1_BH10PAT1_5540 [soil metagenome]